MSEWQCMRTGDCCRIPSRVTMTPEERRALEQARPDIPAQWVTHPDGFVDLVAGPCPYLDGNDCAVYEVRPYNCRRYLCGREPGDPFEPGIAIPLKMLIRPERRDQYHRNQVEAQTWATQHGWSDRG